MTCTLIRVHTWLENNRVIRVLIQIDWLNHILFQIGARLVILNTTYIRGLLPIAYNVFDHARVHSIKINVKFFFLNIILQSTTTSSFLIYVFTIVFFSGNLWGLLYRGRYFSLWFEWNVWIRFRNLLPLSVSLVLRWLILE